MIQSTKKGVGTILIEMVERFFKTHLDICSDRVNHNSYVMAMDSAITFYQHCGYIILSEDGGDKGEDSESINELLNEGQVNAWMAKSLIGDINQTSPIHNSPPNISGPVNKYGGIC